MRRGEGEVVLGRVQSGPWTARRERKDMHQGKQVGRHHAGTCLFWPFPFSMHQEHGEWGEGRDDRQRSGADKQCACKIINTACGNRS